MRRFCKYYAFITAAAVLALLPVPAKAQGMQAQLADKLAAVKQSLAQNQQNLHKYQWTETVQITLK